LVKALYSAASGMLGQQMRQEALANNIANVSTTGYKKAIPVERGFYQIYLNAVTVVQLERGHVPGGGMLLDATASDFSQGPIEHTGERLDVALDGPGFFVVEGPMGRNLYTRNGHFTLNENGELVTENGYRVQGEGGAITARGGNVTLSDDGRVLVDGAESGVLQVVTFDDVRVLVRVGDTMFAAPDDVVPGIEETATMVSGALEASNASVAREMLEMLTTLRNFEANQHVVRAVDSTLDRTINDVGRV
jgi:flagellar basal-body rod protein FlgF